MFDLGLTIGYTAVLVITKKTSLTRLSFMSKARGAQKPETVTVQCGGLELVPCHRELSVTVQAEEPWRFALSRELN